MITMADSTSAASLPAGYDAYAGYVDGNPPWQDYEAISARFPGKPVLSICVSAADNADCLDREPYDATAQEAPGWVRRQEARGLVRPVVYASVSNMQAVINELLNGGVTRASVRLWSAHYGAGEHICGPGTCKLISIPMDGTQFTDNDPGADGSKVDESILEDDFFGAPAPATWQEDMMRQLPTLSAGADGEDVRSIQGLCCARGHTVTIDAVFGPLTETAVKAVQAAAKIAVDGVCGPVTWQVLVTGSA